MARKEQLPDVDLSLPLSVGMSRCLTPPPAAGASSGIRNNGGIQELNLAMEHCDAGRGELQRQSGEDSAKSSRFLSSKSLDISDPRAQKASSVLVTDEKLVPSIPSSDITPASAISMLKDSSSVNKSIMAAKGPEQSLFLRIPYVVATGDGPNGKRTTGILYNQSEGISILCICHGRFFAPAEFVKHAGGTETVHPLREIVVVPS